MIIKSKTYKSKSCFKPILEYLLRDYNHGEGVLYSRFVKGDQTPHDISKQLELNDAFRLHKRSNSIKLHMSILSFHSDDSIRLTDDRLEKIARHWIGLRAPRAISIAIVHRDKSHVHLHVLHSGVNYRTGESIRISKRDFQTRKLAIEGFVRSNFPDLKRSEIDHNSSKKNA